MKMNILVTTGLLMIFGSYASAAITATNGWGIYEGKDAHECTGIITKVVVHLNGQKNIKVLTRNAGCDITFSDEDQATGAAFSSAIGKQVSAFMLSSHELELQVTDSHKLSKE